MSRKALLCIIAACMAGTLILRFRSFYAQSSTFGNGIARPGIEPFEDSCFLHPDVLSQYNLTDTIRYGRIIFATDFTAKRSLEVQSTINRTPLFESVRVVPAADERNATRYLQRVQLENCLRPFRISFPPPEPQVDASHIMFGVATTLERLLASTEQMVHWLSHIGAPLLASVPRHPNTAVVQDYMRSRGINVTIYESEAGLYERYFSLVRLFSEVRDSTTKWASLIDDDTFFLSMPNVLRMLAKYDDKRPQYVGGLSEDFSQMSIFGLVAYGGAGIFISMPLLEELDVAYPNCTEPTWAGDQRLARCIYDYTNTKLAWEPGLHQLDLHGDPSGFYESGRQQPLSVHHWKSWHHVDMVKMSMVSSICGDACILKQVKFLDSWSLTSGYSLVKYGDPESLGAAMEQTWEDYGHADADSYGHSLSPLREQDGEKVSFRIEDSIQADGDVRQVYIYRSGAGVDDYVYEIIWTRS